MATIEFGNVSADMRLTEDAYGVSALQAFEAFLTTFVPMREEVLAVTPTSVMVREYDVSGGFITLSAQGNFTAGQVSSVSVETAGVIAYIFGNFTMDSFGNISGTATQARADFAQNGGLITNFTGLSVPVFISDTLPDLPLDESLLSGQDAVTGGNGNDYLLGYAGNNTIDGGAGVDVAVYNNARAGYTITKTTSGYTVSGPEGNDTLSNIERFQFSDKNLAFDLGLNTAGGNTVRIIGAAFDAPTIQQHPDYVGIGLDLFDGGMSMQQACQLALGTSLYLSLAGSNSNEAFVNTVYKNVVGVLPSAADRDYFAGLLQGSGGTMTQADLLVFAANADVNTVNINLMGLQQSGVEFGLI